VTRGTGQHRDLAADHRVHPLHRPAAGPIAVLPVPKRQFVDAVLAGGGTVEPLSARTTGIVWLSETRADELAVVLEANPGIQWVQLPWAGVDAFGDVLARWSDKPFPLWTSAKGAYSEPVAEHALALTLALLRRFPQKTLAGRWVEKTGIRLLSLFEVEITVVRRSGEPVEGAAKTVAPGALSELLPRADVVVLAAASTDETARLIGAPEFAMMKSSAVLVNIARGALVDTDALVDALHKGVIAGAGLDVTDPEPLPDGHPLWSEPNVLITSHSADTPEMTAPLLASRIRLNVAALHSADGFVGVVDPKAGY